MSGTNIDRSDHYGALQQVVDQLFGEEGDAHLPDEPQAAPAPSAASLAERAGVSQDQAAMLGLAAFDAPAPEPEADAEVVSRLQVVLAAEAADLPEDLMRVVNLLPPGDYTRLKLTTQLNSAITGHAWGQVYGTVS